LHSDDSALRRPGGRRVIEAINWGSKGERDLNAHCHRSIADKESEMALNSEEYIAKVEEFLSQIGVREPIFARSSMRLARPGKKSFRRKKLYADKGSYDDREIPVRVPRSLIDRVLGEWPAVRFCFSKLVGLFRVPPLEFRRPYRLRHPAPTPPNSLSASCAS